MAAKRAAPAVHEGKTGYAKCYMCDEISHKRIACAYYKTKWCKLGEVCRKGDACCFAHGIAELRVFCEVCGWTHKGPAHHPIGTCNGCGLKGHRIQVCPNMWCDRCFSTTHWGHACLKPTGGAATAVAAAAAVCE